MLKDTAQGLQQLNEKFASMAHIYAIINVVEVGPADSSCGWPDVKGVNTEPIVSEFSSTLDLWNETRMGIDRVHFQLCDFNGIEDQDFVAICKGINQSEGRFFQSEAYL